MAVRVEKAVNAADLSVYVLAVISPVGMTYSSEFRDLLDREELLVCPGVHDPITARAAERAGFDALYMTGYGTSLARTGYPDIGLVTMPEMVENAGAIQEAASVPVFCDADTGYGDVKNVIRTVREYVRTGVAGIHIEDQRDPKAGPGGDIQVIPTAEAAEKIRAAADVREEHDSDFLVIGRSDAPEAPDHDVDDAIDRVNAFLDAGADMAFITGQETEDDVKRVGREVDGPLVYDWNGVHPRTSIADLDAYGYDVVIFPLLGTQAAVLETYSRAAAIEEDGVEAVESLVDAYDDLPYSFEDFAGFDEIADWESTYDF